MVDWIANTIAEEVRGSHWLFDSEELKILPHYFSFKFHEPNQYDQLTCDIIVRIRLRHKPYARSLLGVAGDIFEYINTTLKEGGVSLTVGVEIMLAEKADWWSSELQKKLDEEES